MSAGTGISAHAATGRVRALLGSILLAIVPAAWPATAATAPDAAAKAPPAGRTAPGDLGDLAWMTGRWEGEADGTTTEEIWLEPRGGIMLGLHRDLPASGRASFEYLRIENEDDGIVYMASPGGAPPTPFLLVSSGVKTSKRAVFENPGHDFPERITYWLGEDGRLHTRVEGRIDGKPASKEWSWSRRRRAVREPARRPAP